jgi:tRNA-Thr(GGU) m(6)t(6)A37 methyltransferase TsaA
MGTGVIARPFPPLSPVARTVSSFCTIFSQVGMATSPEPIGIVRSPVSEETDEQWGTVQADIHIRPELTEGLTGIEQFSHLLVVFWMHRAVFDPAGDLVRRPRGRNDMPLLGIFAQRAKHRPNPIGITAVHLLGRTDNILTVRGLDAIDGTPVIDIKPYVPQFDHVHNATIPTWMERLMETYF